MYVLHKVIFYSAFYRFTCISWTFRSITNAIRSNALPTKNMWRLLLLLKRSSFLVRKIMPLQIFLKHPLDVSIQVFFKRFSPDLFHNIFPNPSSFNSPNGFAVIFKRLRFKVLVNCGTHLSAYRFSTVVLRRNHFL